MNRAFDLIVDPVGRVPTPSPAPSLASWYTPGLSDALGDRLLMFDNTGGSSLELLRFRRELAAAPGFERALRRRVEQLAAFKHPAFAEVRTVEYLDGDEGLALVSAHTSGKRLSEIFRGPQSHGAVHPAFATRLVRQLASALADLHAQDVAHGALTADRIVLTPDGRVVIVEHVLGSALGQLQLPANRLWADLGIVPPATNGILRLDGRADIIQLGLVTLSVLLGRRVTPAEYPQQLALLLDEFAANAGRHSPSLVPQLRLWLERALQVHGGFESALEAQDGLSQASGATRRHFLEHGRSTPQRGIASTAAARMTDIALASNADSAASGDMRATRGGASHDASVETRVAPDPFVHEEAVGHANTVGRLKSAMLRRRFSVPRNLAASFALLALVEGVALGYLLTTSRNPLAAAKVPVTIESEVSGDVVMVNGRQAGVTPLTLNVGSSKHLIRVLSRDGTRPVGLADAAVSGRRAGVRARTDPRTIETVDARPIGSAQAIALASQRQRFGGLRLSSPIEIHVFEGERLLGSSADGAIVTTAGVHDLDLVNSALGYRSRQTVEIKAGQVVPLTVRPPDGRVSINALPWAQVWIDGKAVGETPLANLSVSVGEHEITFRHPQLGERRETTVVQSGTLTRVSASLGP